MIDLLKGINDIIAPDMENIKRSRTVTGKIFLKYQIYKHINAFLSATAIITFIIVFLFLWFKVVIPFYIMLK